MDDWSSVFYYDVTAPSGLRWACNIPYRKCFGEGSSYVKVVGESAGYLQKSNNRYKVKFRQKSYMVHRIVWELHYGKIPDKQVIDHIDGDSSNNNVSNLRLATQQINAENSGRRKSNKTGVNGVILMEVLDKEYGGSYSYYGATWVGEKRNMRKYFSTKKYGNDEAFRLACEYRATMIAQLNGQGAGYTKRHGT